MENITFNDAIRMAIYYGEERDNSRFNDSEEGIAYYKQCTLLEKQYLKIIKEK